MLLDFTYNQDNIPKPVINDEFTIKYLILFNYIMHHFDDMQDAYQFDICIQDYDDCFK